MRVAGRLAAVTVSLLSWTIVPADAQRLPIKLYTSADGLAHDTVFKIVRDSRGFLWFCTFEGLSRFDGSTFTTYGVADGLPSQVVKDLLETRDGRYWVATDAGICRFNPNGARRRASATSTPGGTAPPAMFTVLVPGGDRGSRVVTSLAEDRAGAIWCGTFGGLYRLDEQNGQVEFRRFGTQNRITSLLEDRRGVLWFGARDGLYRLMADRRVERYPVPLPDNSIQSLMEDREGRLWAGTGRGGLWRLADSHWTSPVTSRKYSDIKGLFQASDGALWAGSREGLLGFVPADEGTEARIHAYAAPAGLDSGPVHSVAEDRNGNLWLGTFGGAARLARKGFTTFTEAEGFNGTSAVLTIEDDLIVVGGPRTATFISRYDGGRLVPIQGVLPPLPGIERLWRENQDLLRDRAGEWWVATRNGLYRFPKTLTLERVARTRPKATYTTRDGLGSNNVSRLFEDSRGDIWIGTAGGLSRWDRASATFHSYGERDGWSWRSLPVSFGEDRTGAVWIGMSIGGGLVRHREGRFTQFTKADGLAEGGTLNLFLDSSGRLWVPMSPGGVFRIDHPEHDRPAIVPYTTAQGLAGNDVEAVAEDHRGRIYLASVRGIDRLDPATGHVRHYTANDGSLRSAVGSAVRAADGSLWIRYGSGLVRLVPEPDTAPRPATMLITGVRISGEPQPLSALGETEVAAVELPAARSQLQIDFVAPGFSPGDGSRYEYQLEGSGGEWTGVGEQRTVHFARLAPGRYRFRVRAISAEGTASGAPANFAFTISPPVWRRWWFQGLALAASLLAGFAFHRTRVARLLDLERVRSRIAADLHDDIGSSLSQISVLSDVVRTQVGSRDGRVLGNVSLINRVSQEALDSMSDIVWAIDPKRDRLGDLVRRMRRVASEVLPARGIDFTFSAPAAPIDPALGADIRRQVFMMFKETLNNMVRHSTCSRADISLALEGPCLVLVVVDDGTGFDPDRVTDGNGLVNLRRRAGALGGEAIVSSRPGDGTAITIKVPHRRHQFM